MLEKNLKLNDERLKRLKIISQINKLGSGFSIAAQDLDMRRWKYSCGAIRTHKRSGNRTLL